MSAGNGPWSLFVVMGIYHLETINDTGTAVSEINYSKVNGINHFHEQYSCYLIDLYGVMVVVDNGQMIDYLLTVNDNDK